MGTNFDFMDACDINFFDAFEVLERAPKAIRKEIKREQRKAAKQAPDFYPEPNWMPTPEDRRP